MSAPAHSVKYVRKRYRKFQIVAASFAAFTIAAAFLAIISGVQVTYLKKGLSSPSAQQRPDLTTENELIQQIEVLNTELAAEKTTSKSLRLRISELEEHLAARKVSIPPATTPKPTPVVKPLPKPIAKPKPIPEPAVKPIPPAPTPEPKPVVTPAPVPAPKPEPVIIPEPRPEPAATQPKTAPATIDEPAPAVQEPEIITSPEVTPSDNAETVIPVETDTAAPQPTAPNSTNLTDSPDEQPLVTEEIPPDVIEEIPSESDIYKP